MTQSLREITFLHGQQTSRPGRGQCRRFDGYYALQFMRGAITYGIEDQKDRILKGCWFWFTYPGPLFRYRPIPESPWTHRHIAFSGDLADHWFATGLIPREPHPCPDSEISNVAEMIDSLLHWSEVPGQLARLKLTNLLENLIIDLHLIRTQERRVSGRRSLGDMVTEELKRRNYRVIKTSELAAKFDLAESTFRRKFLLETGVPVNRYLIEKRLQKARHLLAESRLSIQQVADQAGFSDVFYFHRLFSRAFQTTPKQFQQRTRG